MDRRFNLHIPLACPHCLAELMPTLDDVQQEQCLLCPRCGATIELHPDDAPIPGQADASWDDYTSM